MTHPSEVIPTLREHVLVDDRDLVLDLDASRGSWLVDARDGRRYLDLMSFYASGALGTNHPGLREDPAFMDELARVAVNKPSNLGLFTTQYAEFVEVFQRVVGDPALPHLFFIEGGGPAVENALKVAFDWKSRRNEAAGRPRHLGTRALHIAGAFHGRTGYAMSLTSSAPVKVDRYPTFDWPRIPCPEAQPGDTDDQPLSTVERTALDRARAEFEATPHEVSCFIAEPILGEGGDAHLRPAFLQAMQALCREFDALFVLDEVQTGCGLTGTPWAYQQFGLEPDIVAFGKKFQVCGIMAGRRVDEVADHALRTPSRLGSTWGGNLVDMVRARRILEIIEREGLFARAQVLGADLRDGLVKLEQRHPDVLRQARGRGLMCAIDVTASELRDELVARLKSEERVLVLPGGERAVRFRPHLTVTDEEITAGIEAFERVVRRLKNED